MFRHSVSKDDFCLALLAVNKVSVRSARGSASPHGAPSFSTGEAETDFCCSDIRCFDFGFEIPSR
jgi:hypothetical protein